MYHLQHTLSQTMKQLGYEVILLEGGYKNYREWALNVFNEGGPSICVVGGRTGSGKTRILHALREHGSLILDLEGLANHRGSSFGWVAQDDQPSSEQYQNIVANEWFKLPKDEFVFVEDEASNVGTCTVPPVLYNKIRAAPLVIKVVLPMEARLHLLLEDYTSQEARALTEDYLPRLRVSIENMSKRLGGQKTKEILQLFDEGNARGVIHELIVHYDKLYDKHLKNATGNGSGSGEREGTIVSVEADPACTVLDASEVALKMQVKASEYCHLIASNNSKSTSIFPASDSTATSSPSDGVAATAAVESEVVAEVDGLATTTGKEE
jgi:tRNA 2-selenouridine synthase